MLSEIAFPREQNKYESVSINKRCDFSRDGQSDAEQMNRYATESASFSLSLSGRDSILVYPPNAHIFVWRLPTRAHRSRLFSSHKFRPSYIIPVLIDARSRLTYALARERDTSDTRGTAVINILYRSYVKPTPTRSAGFPVSLGIQVSTQLTHDRRDGHEIPPA